MPSAEVAAAVLLVARRNLKLTPAGWRPELETMTSFTLAEVAPVADRIFEGLRRLVRNFRSTKLERRRALRRRVMRTRTA